KKIVTSIFIAIMVFVASAQVPEYYKEYLTTKISLVNDKERNIGASGEVFVYLTDTHTAANQMTSVHLIKDICTMTTVEKIIFGGDIVVAYGDEQKMYNCVMKHINSFDAVVSPYARLYNIIGNHDIIIKDNSNPENAVSYTATDQ